MIDPRTPVIAGVGQVNQTVDIADLSAVRSPVGLLVDAARLADAESRGLLSRCDTIAVVQIGSWRYANPARIVARELGLEPKSHIMSSIGGNSSQLLANEMAAAIQRGERDVVLIGGGESLQAKRKARKAGIDLQFEISDDESCNEIYGMDKPGTSETENAHGAFAPTQVYPLFETALRASAGRSVEEHQQFIGDLWAHFSAVASQNPHAWSRQAHSAKEIYEATPNNRIVTFPYTKLMNSNIDVDQGAAILLSSYGTARAAGIPDEQLVFLHAGADAHDHWYFSSRDSLSESVAIGVVVRSALSAASIGLDDIARFDLYSCFPAAVQLAMKSIGLAGLKAGDTRPLTVTGGLSFGGGPLNNYSTHGIAQMTEVLRADPGSFGLTTALGWYATKHSCGIWSTTPPKNGFTRVPESETQALVDATPMRNALIEYSGKATVEATAVPFTREGEPRLGIVIALTDAGERVLANVHEPDALKSMCTDGWENRVVDVVNHGGVAATNRIGELA